MVWGRGKGWQYGLGLLLLKHFALRVDSLVPLMLHDLSDLRSLILM